ncbi:MAG: quinone oxidoreductase, partial [Rhizorhabdus sp.]|nr:quinone oxidoreductase [Rhizorhabdus sp.]
MIERESFVAGAPAAGDVFVRHKAIGVNFIDIYHRTGLYPQELPAGLGVEAVGIVEAVGDGVDGFAIGDRVVYATAQPGSYATRRMVAAGQL